MNGVISAERPYTNAGRRGDAPFAPGGRALGSGTMWRLIKVLLTLAVLAGLALVAYAYVGPTFLAEDFAPPARMVTTPVDLGLDE